ncbi:bifunctional glycosyltransferase family 2/GtrA family protein [Weissella hellenica]|nr:bifunctional glycosyltransferase family 2/GtrA family protein [Weissella hellenica]
MNNKLCDIAILIPAFNPDEKLLKLLFEIHQQKGFNQDIIIINDGSEDDLIFSKIQQNYSKVKILTHEKNRGKGQALKTGFNFILTNKTNIKGVATIDSDGQHKVVDLKKLEHHFMKHMNDLIIGSRNFGKDVPLRSKVGNIVTNQLVNLLTGIKVSDTKTGLRIFPIKYIKQLITFSSNRYEFEFDMLLATKKAGINIREVPIQTVYLDNNATSHFRVIADSLSIYSRFFKFAFSGMGSFLIDIVCFYIFIYLMVGKSGNAILLATIIARLCSAIFNYIMNKKFVFSTSNSQPLIKYVVLMLSQMLISGLLTTLLTHLARQMYETGWITLIKIIVDSFLFLISYQIQKHIVFKKVVRSNAA